jgi:hypothetical protein
MTRLFEQVGGVANELSKLIRIDGEKAEEIISQLKFADYLSLINAVRTADAIEAQKIIDELDINLEAAVATKAGSPTTHATSLPPNVGQGLEPVDDPEDDPPQTTIDTNPLKMDDKKAEESATTGATAAGNIAVMTAPLTPGVPHRRRKKKDD